MPTKVIVKDSKLDELLDRALLAIKRHESQNAATAIRMAKRERRKEVGRIFVYDEEAEMKADVAAYEKAKKSPSYGKGTVDFDTFRAQIGL